MAEEAERHDRGDELFTRSATDNAQVVPPRMSRSHDELWSTESEPGARPEGMPPPPGASSARLGDPGPFGDVFSAEPVAPEADVVDEAVDEPPSSVRFGLGNGNGSETLWEDLPAPPDLNSPSSPDWSVLRNDPVGDDTPPAAEPLRVTGATDDAAPLEDPNGFEAVVRALDPADRGVATVPLAVSGALLLPGERVHAVVTGSMLGAPAVLVLTGARVLVVNDRRWQPVVDIYRLDHRLTVRGRSDRGVAAISLSDEDRLSMIDGVTDVASAVSIAERIRAAAGAA